MPKSPTSKVPIKMKRKRVKTLSQKIKVFRSSDPLVTVFMWGVSHSINDLMHVPQRVMLMPDDFKAFIKLKVENQNFNKEHMPSNFKFKEYCPLVFKNLRERFGVSEQEYLDSIVRGEPIPKDIAGRSGSKFFLTVDKKFLIKSLASEELEKMHHLLKYYHEHVVETRGRTLLPQYLALYRITVNNTETYMVVMRNVFSQKLKVHYKYDLKGSTVGREASEKERNAELPTFKDNDFIEGGHKIFLGFEQKQVFMDILRTDVQFLEKNSLIDYSLLVGMHNSDEGGYASGAELNEDEEQFAASGDDELLSDLEVELQNNNNNNDKNNTNDAGETTTTVAAVNNNDSSGGQPRTTTTTTAEVTVSPTKRQTSASSRRTAGTGQQQQQQQRATSMIVGNREADEFHSSISGATAAAAAVAAAVQQQRQESVITNKSTASGVRHGSGDAAAATATPLRQNRFSGGGLGSSNEQGGLLGDADRGLRVHCWSTAADAPVRFVYFLAIIDVLTHYGVKKATAQAAKTVKYGAGAEISTVRPEHYGKRFVDFLDQIIV